MQRDTRTERVLKRLFLCFCFLVGPATEQNSLH